MIKRSRELESLSSEAYHGNFLPPKNRARTKEHIMVSSQRDNFRFKQEQHSNQGGSSASNIFNKVMGAINGKPGAPSGPYQVGRCGPSGVAGCAKRRHGFMFHGKNQCNIVTKCRDHLWDIAMHLGTLKPCPHIKPTSHLKVPIGGLLNQVWSHALLG